MSQVVLSKNTLEVLKNFSTINNSILIRKGNVLKTISLGENTVAEFICEEEFPQTFGIYDLPQLLSGITLFRNPVLQFDSTDYVNIVSDAQSVKYYFSNPEITLKAAPEKSINFPDTDIEFNLFNKSIESIKKASLIYNLPDLCISSTKESQIVLKVCDRENDTSNVYNQFVTGESTGEFEFYMKVENLRLYAGNYSVKVSSKLITEWKHTDIDLKYYIALEP